MSGNNLDSLIQHALSMPDFERARIAEAMISSLDKSPQRDVEVAWQNEIDKRIREIDSGTVDMLPWEDVKHRLYG